MEVSKLLLLFHIAYDGSPVLSIRNHVYRDLHPYVCLEKHCTKASEDFQKRKQWARHMLKAHWRTWTCPFGCALGFRTSKDCRCHVLEVHPTQASTAKVENLVALSSNTDPRCAEGKCPLCLTFDIKNSRMYESHVGRHLEQLSLFVLPQIDGDESEQEEGAVLPQVSDDESEPQIERDDDTEEDQHGYMNPLCGLVRGCQRPRMHFSDGRQAVHCDQHFPCAKSGPPEGCRQIAVSRSDFCLAHKCSLEGCIDGKESSSSSHYCKQHTCHNSSFQEINDTKDDPDDEGKPEPSRNSVLRKALQKAKTAVELDNAQIFQGARSDYQEACDLLHQVLLRTAGDEDKKSLEGIVSPRPRLPFLLLPRDY